MGDRRGRHIQNFKRGNGADAECLPFHFEHKTCLLVSILTVVQYCLRSKIHVEKDSIQRATQTPRGWPRTIAQASSARASSAVSLVFIKNPAASQPRHLPALRDRRRAGVHRACFAVRFPSAAPHSLCGNAIGRAAGDAPAAVERQTVSPPATPGILAVRQPDARPLTHTPSRPHKRRGHARAMAAAASTNCRGRRRRERQRYCTVL